MGPSMGWPSRPCCAGFRHRRRPPRSSPWPSGQRPGAASQTRAISTALTAGRLVRTWLARGQAAPAPGVGRGAAAIAAGGRPHLALGKLAAELAGQGSPTDHDASHGHARPRMRDRRVHAAIAGADALMRVCGTTAGSGSSGRWTAARSPGRARSSAARPFAARVSGTNPEQDTKQASVAHRRGAEEA